MEHQLGWDSVYAYNNEDFEPDGLLGRSSTLLENFAGS
jgi:type I restriction enzyme R subunit